MLMLEVGSLSDYGTRRSYLTKLAAAVESVRGVHGNRVAMDYLLKGIGLQLSPRYNDAYFSEALDYHLGVLYAHLGDQERAAAVIKRSGALPGAESDSLFPDHCRQSIELQRQMLQARERGLPSILLASMPRSASASLTQSLAATMNAPILRASAGNFPNACLVSQWFNSVSPGGAVLHDHFGASAANLKVLEEGECREIFVLVRDPRAAAASCVNFMFRNHPDASARYLEACIMEHALAGYYPWLAEWITAAQNSALRVRWIKSADVRANMVSTITSILEHLQPLYPPVVDLLNSVKEVKANFVAGLDDAWRSSVSPSNQARLWEAIPPGAIELLDLHQ